MGELFAGISGGEKIPETLRVWSELPSISGLDFPNLDTFLSRKLFYIADAFADGCHAEEAARIRIAIGLDLKQWAFAEQVTWWGAYRAARELADVGRDDLPASSMHR